MHDLGEAMHAEAEITFDCSKCGQHLGVDANGAGQIVTCPVCRESLMVPSGDVLARIAAITYAAPEENEPADTSPEWSHDPEDAEVSALREQLVETVRLRCRMERELVSARTEVETLQVQLRRSAEENSRLTAQLNQMEAGRRELEHSLADLTAQYEKLKNSAFAKDAALAERAESLRETQWALEKSEKKSLGLTQETTRLRAEIKQLRERASLVESLQTEVANLRRDFEASTEAQECNRLRARAEAAEERRRVEAREAEYLRAEIEQLLKAGDQLRGELKEAQERCMAAEQRAEELSIAKVQSDNEVLRGVLARQKAELENCYRELKRFRRSELGLKLVYALFALGLLGVAAFAMQVLPGIADVL